MRSEKQIKKMEDKGAFRVLNEQEILNLGELPHLFTQYNWVFNPNSESTPFRLITNTSAINSGTTISIEQMTPQKILNPMLNSLVRFSLYSVPLCADVASAYHCLLVDSQTAPLFLVPRCGRQVGERKSFSAGHSGLRRYLSRLRLRNRHPKIHCGKCSPLLLEKYPRVHQVL